MSRAALQALVASPSAPAAACRRVTTGQAEFDSRLGGGLAEAGLHEIFDAGDDPGGGGAATGFALLLALRCARPGPIVWLREARTRGAGRVYGPGLAELGGDPARLLLVQAPDTLGVLRAGVEAIGCSAVAVVIIEPWGKAAALDLTASRRLALAAARSGVFSLVLRGGEPPPSAAASRWRVAAAPSRILAAQAPGAPAFDITLLRHRGGIAGFETRLEWNRDRRAFGPHASGPHAFGTHASGTHASGTHAFGAPLSGAAPAAVVQRAVAADRQRAA